MTKNLIKQMMVKTSDAQDKFDASAFVETINKGYTANLETKFQIKKKFLQFYKKSKLLLWVLNS